MKKLFSFILAAAVAVITACDGGSSSSPDPENTLTGTAAVGAAVSGTVYVRDSLDALASGVIGADGTFSISTEGMTGPFVLMAIGNVGTKYVQLYSTIGEPGNVNVTPATTLIMHMALQEDPEELYDPVDMMTEGADIPDAPAAVNVNDAKEELSSILVTVMTEVDSSLDGSFDLVSGSFTADGTGFDKVLDVVSLEAATSGSETVITIGSTSTGTIFYEKNVTTDTATVTDLDSFVDVIEEEATDLDLARATLENIYSARNYPVRFSGSIPNADDIDAVEVLLEANYAGDALFLDEGVGRTTAINNFIADKSDLEEGFFINVHSWTLKNIRILGRMEAFSFSTTTVNIPEFNGNPAAPGLTVSGEDWTFTEKTLICETTCTAIMGEQTFTMTGYDYFINEGTDDEPDWKWLGSQSPMDRFRVEGYMERSITNGGIPEISTGISLSFREYDESEALYDIDAILVMGDGIRAEYNSSGDKGLLLLRSEGSDEFEIVNGNSTDMGHQDYLEIDEDISSLDITAMGNRMYRYIALRLNDNDTSNTFTAGDTFTPVYTGVKRLNYIPIAGTVLSASPGSYFATFTAPAATSLDGITGITPETPSTWTLAYAWSLPAGLSFYSLGAGFKFDWTYGSDSGTNTNYTEEEGNVYNGEYTAQMFNPMICTGGDCDDEGDTSPESVELNEIEFSVSSHDLEGREIRNRLILQ
ncbi:MAG: hypothetical protein CVV44_10800 [Spirochaetae bacterium HGW-Spirochaetae-1]|jgi:hypothetical protein|nr:MAG: hypothetical protein CVV44_10800 [Spirochaetae bacterium HGW-Spirochaetae-1]